MSLEQLETDAWRGVECWRCLDTGRFIYSRPPNGTCNCEAGRRAEQQCKAGLKTGGEG